MWESANGDSFPVLLSGSRVHVNFVVPASGVDYSAEVHVFLPFFFDHCDDFARVALAEMIGCLIGLVDQISFDVKVPVQFRVFEVFLGERSDVNDRSLEHAACFVHSQLECCV